MAPTSKSKVAATIETSVLPRLDDSAGCQLDSVPSIPLVDLTCTNQPPLTHLLYRSFSRSVATSSSGRNKSRTKVARSSYCKHVAQSKDRYGGD